MSQYRAYFVPNGVDPSGSFTLGDAKASLKKKGVKKLGTCIERGIQDINFESPDLKVQCYTDSQVFKEWVALEKTIGSWWKNLPKCPKKIHKCRGKWVATDDQGFDTDLDLTDWNEPTYLKITTAEQALHPDTKGKTFNFGMRSKDIGRHRNQCNYQGTVEWFLPQRGTLITTAPTAGTVDFKPSLSDGHIGHDVLPILLADRLDGGKADIINIQARTAIQTTPGKFMLQYFALRPSW